MKKIVMSVAVVLAASSAAIAQETTTTTSQSPAATVTVTNISEPVTVLSGAQSQDLVQQPITVVQASPLSLSRAEQMRKAREQQEVETEQKIVEKLEESRLDAEAKRQNEILGNIADKKEERKQEAVVVAPVPVAVAPVAPVAPAAPVVVEVSKGLSIDEVRSAVREELSVKAADVQPEKKKEQSYMSATLGSTDYDTEDIEPVLSVGLNIGRTFDDRWAIEFRTAMGNAFVDDYSFMYREMDQYSFGIGTKMNILTGRIRPVVGFDVSYVYRDYSEQRDSVSGYPFEGTELSSKAIDYSFIAGLDFSVSDNLALGLEYKYTSNLSYRMDNEILNTPLYRNEYGYWSPLEDRDSSTVGVQLKYLF